LLDDGCELAEAISTAAAGDELGGWPRWSQGVEYPSCPRCAARMALVFHLDSEDNFPRRYNGALSQEPLVIRQNHKTGERTLEPLRWGLDPLLVQGPKRRPSPHHKSKARSSTASLVTPLISRVNSGIPALELKSGTYSGRPDV